MELHYYLHTFEEDNTHKTWSFIMVDHLIQGQLVGTSENGWTKLPMPKNLTKEEELDWYITSNREDLHFVMKESESCIEWKMKLLDEIIKAQKDNKKIKSLVVSN